MNPVVAALTTAATVATFTGLGAMLMAAAPRLWQALTPRLSAHPAALAPIRLERPAPVMRQQPTSRAVAPRPASAWPAVPQRITLSRPPADRRRLARPQPAMVSTGAAGAARLSRA
jgi:hypothetical protein